MFIFVHPFSDNILETLSNQQYYLTLLSLFLDCQFLIVNKRYIQATGTGFLSRQLVYRLLMLSSLWIYHSEYNNALYLRQF